MITAIINGQPPTILTVVRVTVTEIAFRTLRPKLSDKELSIPIAVLVHPMTGREKNKIDQPSKSFPNLFNKRPREIVSWNLIFVNNTLSNSPAQKGTVNNELGNVTIFLLL